MSFKDSRPVTEKQYQRWQRLMRLGRACGCHQLPDRSFYYRNFQFPLCARCTGILIGQFIIGPIVFLLGFRSLIWSFIFIGLMGLDGGLQYLKIYPSTNIRRLITGLLSGIAFTTLLFLFIIYLFS